jgi:hypothetical protein
MESEVKGNIGGVESWFAAIEGATELSHSQILRVLTIAPPSGSDPKAEAAWAAQLLEATRMHEVSL